MRLAGAKLCRTFMPCQGIWTFFGGNCALGEEMKAVQGLFRPACYEAPWAMGWGAHRRSEAGG